MTGLHEVVDNFRTTCFACPTIIEGRLPDGREVYLRYRYGVCRIVLDGTVIYMEQIGDSLDGVLDDTEARQLIVTALEIAADQN